MSRKHPMTKSTRRWLPQLLVSALLLLGLGGWRIWLDLEPSVSIPTPAIVSPNAYADYLNAADIATRVPGVNEIGSPQLISHRRAFLQRNRRALDLLRRGFRYPYRQLPLRSLSTLLPPLLGCRSLGWCLQTEANERAERGNWAGAA